MRSRQKQGRCVVKGKCCKQAPFQDIKCCNVTAYAKILNKHAEISTSPVHANSCAHSNIEMNGHKEGNFQQYAFFLTKKKESAFVMQLELR